MKKAIITTKKLCKTFSQGGIQEHVLKNLDISLYNGDFTVIMGASGSGKSTLLYSLSGMDRPSLGEIYFSDKNITKYSNDMLAVFRRKNCGFIFQQIFLMDSMSVLDNVMVCGLLVEKDKKQVAVHAKKLLSQVGLSEEDWRKFPSQLSGGQAQRVGVVRALINRPQAIFADEPTGALNSASGEAVLKLLTQFNDQGQSIVLVTHDVRSALRGNRILYLKDGIIGGECSLERYTPNNKSRDVKLSGFLSEMGW